VRQVGDNCYQWGNQKVYCGKDAKRKAILQGIAIENTGWREAEQIKITNTGTPTHKPLLLPSHFNENNPTFMLHEGYLLISQDREGKWRVWDMDAAAFKGWNRGGSPNYSSYNKKYEMTDPYYHQFDSLEDALAEAEYSHEWRMAQVEAWLEGQKMGEFPMGMISKSMRSVLKMKMTAQEKRDARHPNRGEDWIPYRVRKDTGAEIKGKIICPTCKETLFPSLEAAKRHHFYCEKYGYQPPNKRYFTPMEMMMVQQGLLKKESETISSSHSILFLGALSLGFLIPYFLDSRANKV
tara:strand:- start:1608 stop:2492 length:885 start_codon:yes stop_codon:yes gene_type:complete